MKSKYITIKICKKIIKESKFPEIRNECTHLIWNIKNSKENKNMDIFGGLENKKYLVYENDLLYKFIKG